MDADGAKGPGRFMRAVGQDQFGFGKHDVADNKAVSLHHEIQRRDEIRIVPVTMKNIMFRTSGAIHIPKSFPGEIFYNSVIGRFFKPDAEI